MSAISSPRKHLVTLPRGNVGEFLKNLPGIDLDYVEADARNPRVRGLSRSYYTSVTYNGMNLASADGFIQNNGTDNGGGAGAGDRSFGFEQVSMSNVDAVEVNYTTNASQDASSPAGSINLRPSHALLAERTAHHLPSQCHGRLRGSRFFQAIRARRREELHLSSERAV